MATNKSTKSSATVTDPFALLAGTKLQQATDSHVHTFGNGFKCRTESRGHATPNNKSPAKLVLDASEGFIPLWAKGSTLRWRFQESSLAAFADPEAAKAAVRKLLGNALLAWGDAVPVKFSERQDNWDFEISVREADDCDINGCTLASAFFPDAGQHELVIYPQMFAQSEREQTETLAHEFGHVFGLRHFFALLKEKAWPAEIFGAHNPFSIMNYGELSALTDYDRRDLKTLYQLVWSHQLTSINKTEIRLVRPHHLVAANPSA